MTSRRIKIQGKYWNLEFVPASDLPKDWIGSCDSPEMHGKSIKVYDKLKGRLRLSVLCHEMLHSAAPFAKEEWVDEVAEDISTVLWNLGYRGPEDAN